MSRETGLVRGVSSTKALTKVPTKDLTKVPMKVPMKVPTKVLTKTTMKVTTIKVITNPMKVNVCVGVLPQLGLWITMLKRVLKTWEILSLIQILTTQ